jgi:hypothetical protein
MKKIATSLSIALALSLAAVAAADHHEKPMGDMGLFSAAQMQWGEGPPSLQKGAAMAVLEGDSAKEGMFTMRLRFPDGFEVKPHYHSQIEHVTVISGTLHFGMGDKFDRAKTRPMPAGSFGFWPIGMKHFAYAEGETVLQLHGRGPWTITYVDPTDDPRGKK